MHYTPSFCPAVCLFVCLMPVPFA